MRSLIAVGFVFFVTACGGGKDSTESSASSEPPVSGVVASISSDVPDSIRTQVNQIATPNGLTDGGSAPTLSAGTTSLIVANNADGDPLLLAIDSSNGVLSAQSTALALVRIAVGLGAVPAGQNIDELEKSIQSAASYLKLKDSINSSWQAGRSPILDAEVRDATWLVIEEIHATTQALRASFPSVRPLAVDVDKPSPFYFFDWSPFTERVWIEDVNGGGGVNLMNRTLINWHVKSDDMEGLNLTDERIGPMEAIDLGPFGNPFSLFLATPSQTFLPFTRDEAVVTLEQDKTTREANALSVARQGFFALMAVLGKAGPSEAETSAQYKCASALFEALVPAEVIKFTQEPSVDIAKGLLREIIIKFKEALIAKCSRPEALVKKEAEKALINSVLKVWSAFTFTDRLVKTATVAYQTWDYWNYAPRVYRVCLNQGKITPCVFTGVATVTNTTTSGFYSEPGFDIFCTPRRLMGDKFDFNLTLHPFAGKFVLTSADDSLEGTYVSRTGRLDYSEIYPRAPDSGHPGFEQEGSMAFSALVENALLTGQFLDTNMVHWVGSNPAPRTATCTSTIGLSRKP